MQQQVQEKGVLNSVVGWFSGIVQAVRAEWQRIQRDFRNARRRAQNHQIIEQKLKRIQAEKTRWKAGDKTLGRRDRLQKEDKTLTRVNHRIGKREHLTVDERSIRMCRDEEMAARMEPKLASAKRKIDELNADTREREEALRKEARKELPLPRESAIKRTKLKNIPVPRTPAGTTILPKAQWPPDVRKELLGEPTDEEAYREELRQRIAEHANTLRENPSESASADVGESEWDVSPVVSAEVGRVPEIDVEIQDPETLKRDAWIDLNILEPKPVIEEPQEESNFESLLETAEEAVAAEALESFADEPTVEQIKEEDETPEEKAMEDPVHPEISEPQEVDDKIKQLAADTEYEQLVGIKSDEVFLLQNAFEIDQVAVEEE